MPPFQGGDQGIEAPPGYQPSLIAKSTPPSCGVDCFLASTAFLSEQWLHTLELGGYASQVMNYEVRLSRTAAAMLLEITDPTIRQQIAERARRLADDPEKQGGHLKGALSRYRKCRASGRRYRILYRIDQSTSTVIVVAIGARSPGNITDIYRFAGQLLQEGLLE